MLQLDVTVDVELVVVTVIALRALDLARLSLKQLPPLVGLHVRLKEEQTVNVHLNFKFMHDYFALFDLKKQHLIVLLGKHFSP